MTEYARDISRARERTRHHRRVDASRYDAYRSPLRCGLPRRAASCVTPTAKLWARRPTEMWALCKACAHTRRPNFDSSCHRVRENTALALLKLATVLARGLGPFPPN